MEFSRQRACILSRSALQLLYLSPSPATTASMAQSAMNIPPGQLRPQHPFVEILRESVKNFVNPPALTPKSPMISSPQVSCFQVISIASNRHGPLLKKKVLAFYW